MPLTQAMETLAYWQAPAAPEAADARAGSPVVAEAPVLAAMAAAAPRT
jgi:hypothetical protein